MPTGGRKEPPRAVELESATVASPISGREVELPAMWNRMFEPRVLTGTGPDAFEPISALPGGVTSDDPFNALNMIGTSPTTPG